MFLQSKVFPTKSNEINTLKYISTYKLGQIGITKLIEEPLKSSLNIDNNLMSQNVQINQNPSNTNTNNTNSNNTNTNTNTNTHKAIDNIVNKKILKNHHSASHNFIHIQSSSNFNCYKKRNNKPNQGIDILNINKNDKKPLNEAVKLNRDQFSKTTNNLGLYINNNIYNKHSYKNSYSKNKIKSKSNSKIHSESGYSNYILSSRTPSSIKRNQKKYILSDFIGKEKNETNINSFKKDNAYDLFTKTTKNRSCIDIIQNSKKKKEENKYDSSYQMNEFNTYLKVRKRSDIQSQKHANSKLKAESNKLLSPCFFNKENKNSELSEIKDNIYLSEVLSTEDNIKRKPNIKLICDENKNTNRLHTESNQKQNKFKNIENNICSNTKKQNTYKNIYSPKTNFYNNKSKNSGNKDLNINKFGSKTYSQTKNSNNKTNKLKDKKTENININNYYKNKSNYNSKNKNSHKTKKDNNVNTSKTQILKETNMKNKNNKTNIGYSSFVDINNNNDNGVKKEKNSTNEINGSNSNKDINFECPEELHFFMVNLTHNCIYANSKF